MKVKKLYKKYLHETQNLQQLQSSYKTVSTFIKIKRLKTIGNKFLFSYNNHYSHPNNHHRIIFYNIIIIKINSSSSSKLIVIITIITIIIIIIIIMLTSSSNPPSYCLLSSRPILPSKQAYLYPCHMQRMMNP